MRCSCSITSRTIGRIITSTVRISLLPLPSPAHPHPLTSLLSFLSPPPPLILPLPSLFACLTLLPAPNRLPLSALLPLAPRIRLPRQMAHARPTAHADWRPGLWVYVLFGGRAGEDLGGAFWEEEGGGGRWRWRGSDEEEKGVGGGEGD